MCLSCCTDKIVADALRHTAIVRLRCYSGQLKNADCEKVHSLLGASDGRLVVQNLLPMPLLGVKR